MQTKRSTKPKNDNAAGINVGININIPIENWLDFKSREFVLLWSNNTETRYKLDDDNFKYYLEKGTPLKNL